MRLADIGIHNRNGPALRYPGSQAQCEGGLAGIGASENQARTSIQKALPLKILRYSVGPVLRHQSSHLANGYRNRLRNCNKMNFHKTSVSGFPLARE
jgi:hypothetical protein